MKYDNSVNRALLLIVILFLAGIGIAYVVADRSDDGENNGVVTTPENGVGTSTPIGGGGNATSTAGYFQSRLITLGVEDIGQPIEGFDANLLMIAFPGLIPADFQGVRAREGVYTVRNDEVVFTRGTAMPITSAERMVADEGYIVLLQNVSKRLGILPSGNGAIDQIITRVNTGERVETSINQSGTFLGVRVLPLRVIEDSRCPADVQCIQAGTVKVEARLESSGQTSTRVFTLNTPVETATERITLTQVLPEKTIADIKSSDYLFTFHIEKK